MREIIDRIDIIVKALRDTRDWDYTYMKYLFEIKQLMIQLVGKDNDAFLDFEDVTESKIDNFQKCNFLIGVLNGLKDTILHSLHNKKYQIFVSSTYKDLVDYRKAIADEITFRGHIVSGMEDFTACGDDLESYIKKVIDESDYYILVIGQRWGSCLPDNDEISFTMMEYNYAKAKGMRIIPLIYNGDEKLSGNDLADNGDKFNKFIAEIKKTVPQYFKNENELIRKLMKSLDSEIKNYPQKGWIRL